MKFKFRLERVLGFLKLRETKKMFEVSSSQKRITLLERRKTELERQMLQILTQNSRHPWQWALYQASQVPSHRKDIRRLIELIEEEKENLQTHKKMLAQILMKKKGIENLKEKNRREFSVMANQKEQKEMDESFRFFRERQ